jgi:hypothetical protein
MMTKTKKNPAHKNGEIFLKIRKKQVCLDITRLHDVDLEGIYLWLFPQMNNVCKTVSMTCLSCFSSDEIIIIMRIKDK